MFLCAQSVPPLVSARPLRLQLQMAVVRLACPQLMILRAEGRAFLHPRAPAGQSHLLVQVVSWGSTSCFCFFVCPSCAPEHLLLFLLLLIILRHPLIIVLLFLRLLPLLIFLFFFFFFFFFIFFLFFSCLG